MLLDPAPEEFQTHDTKTLTYMDVLATRLMADALNGDRAAREQVLNRVDGKPSMAEKVRTPDTTVEDQLDALAVQSLNKLLTE